MSEAHDEMRKRLTAYREAKALYESPDPYDREEARYDAMHAARARLCDEALAEALLDEHDRLNEALGLAYPRALQAAADVVLNADLSLFDESWACEVVEKRVVNVREWCAANAPEWLAQLTALDDEEGGDHG